ncbi:MAG TPA: terminase family protein [Acidimicrobiales bacterium]|nr:terminase family protein [Acidimicrobiales bacterium]
MAVALGQPFMPWQRQVADTMLEVDDDGLLVYRQAILSLGRQAGKTLLGLCVLITLSLRRPRQHLLYTAQTRADARKKLTEDWIPLLEGTPLYRETMLAPRLANGSEALRFRNGSMAGLLAGTKKSGHGGTLDAAIVDEAFAQPDSRLEVALKPAMMTRPDPLLLIMSAAGTPVDSPYLLDKVERGREIAESGMNSLVYYAEWSAPDDMDPGDPATWRVAMPALGITVTEESVRADFLSMGLSDFRRTYLNQFVESMNDPVISLAVWDALADPASGIDSALALAVDVSPSRSEATIAASGKRPDGQWHTEVIDQGAGTDWIVPRATELAKTHRAAIVIDGASPAASLVIELERQSVTVITTGAADMAKACGQFYDAATSGRLHHLGTPELRAALNGASKRPIGDAWGWSRKASNIDITPIVSSTLSLFGSQTYGSRGELVWDLSEVVARLRREDAAKASAAPDAAPPATPHAAGQPSISLSDWWDKYGHNLAEEEADDDEGD